MRSEWEEVLKEVREDQKSEMPKGVRRESHTLFGLLDFGGLRGDGRRINKFMVGVDGFVIHCEGIIY